MRRREFIAAVGWAAAWPMVARAQQAQKVPLVGALMPFEKGDEEAERRQSAFQNGLEQLGWRNGQNIRIEYRWAGGDPNRYQSHAADLVGLAPDVIIATATPVLAAVRAQTRTIPIVFVQVIDPVSRGLVNSLARPGGNITGFTNFEFPIGGNCVEMLKVITPRVKSTAVLFNPDTAPYGEPFFQQIKASASSLSIEAVEAQVKNGTELTKAVEDSAAKLSGSLIILPDTYTTVHRDTIIELAGRHQLPSIYPFRY